MQFAVTFFVTCAYFPDHRARAIVVTEDSMYEE